MFKVTIVYISNVPVEHFIESNALTSSEKKKLFAVTAAALKKGDIVESPSKTFEFGGKKISHTVSFKDEQAYTRYVEAQEKAVPSYITKRAAFYESKHVAVNEKTATV